MVKVTIIGGSVIDMFLYPHQEMNLYDSNPGYLKQSLGGVGRNIAENLARLGIDTTLITPLGNDHYQQMILDQASSIGLKICPIAIEKTPLYVSIMDKNGEDLIGVAVMDEIMNMTISEILVYQEQIDQADILVMDTNLSNEVLTYFLKKYGNKVYIDAISGQKAIKLKPMLSLIHTLKLNVIEAKTLAGFGEDSREGIHTLGTYFITQGVKEIYITWGDKGAFYATHNHKVFREATPVDIVGATGAGDAFFAGVIYAAVHQKNGLLYGMANAYLNLLDAHAVNPTLNMNMIENKIKEWLQ